MNGSASPPTPRIAESRNPGLQRGKRLLKIVAWLAAEVLGIAERERAGRQLARMSERDLKDIGLITTDVAPLARGRPPPTFRPPEGGAWRGQETHFRAKRE